MRKFGSAKERVRANASIAPDKSDATGYERRKKVQRIYQFTNNWLDNMDNFFYFNKNLVRTDIWANLGKCAKAIYPVIACHCDQKKGNKAFPSQLTIAILSGYKIPSVKNGIQELKNTSSMEFKVLPERHHNSYEIILPARQSTAKFKFHKAIIDSGTWRELSPSAKALYPAMRTLSHFNPEDLDEYAPEFDYEKFNFQDEVYSYRQYDFCTETKAELCRRAGIDRKSFETSLENLIEIGLVSPGTGDRGNEYWKVNFYPIRNWKQDYLNEKVKRLFKIQG